jgi:hypothetical protein
MQTFAVAISKPINLVRGHVSCGSIVVDLYVITPTPDDVLATQTAINAALGTAAAAQSVFSVPVERITTAYTTIIPSAPPASDSAIGAIVGGVVGGLAAVSMLIGGVFWYKKKKKAKVVGVASA